MIPRGGRRVVYALDAMGRVAGITTYQNSGALAQTVVANVSWNPYGPVAGMSFGNGIVASYTLDSIYRVTRAPATVRSALDRSLTWIDDEALSIVDNVNAGATPPFTYSAQSQSFAYTPAHRLASASGYYGQYSWTYDLTGNRTSETLSGVASTYAYTAGTSRLAAVTSGLATRSFSYDAAGDIVADTRVGALGMSFAYDVEGRLATAYQTGLPSPVATYGYDAFGRLASRSANGTTILYVHDVNDHIVAETDVTGATQREYIWLGDIPVAVVDGVASNPTLYYVHSDHLARPAKMTDANQNLVWDVIYAPFGVVSYINQAPENIDIRFPGQWFQLETGLAYNWHRHYDATLGRYLQADPIGLTGGVSLYGYAGGTPLGYVDPFGLEVGEPGTLESIIPVWGSGRQAINDYQTGQPVWGTINIALAVSDVFLLKSVAQGICKGAWKFGSNTWGATRKWYGRTRDLPTGTPVHHWLIERNGEFGTYMPDFIKNQPWNLNAIYGTETMTGSQVHNAIHGWGSNQFNLFDRWWHGTPGWAKLGEAGLLGKISNTALHNNNCGCAQ
jgi:RHS repeat-associated protein